jgi:hypothetical protein
MLSQKFLGAGEGASAVGKFSFELFVHELMEDFAHLGAWGSAEPLEVMTGEKWFRFNFFLRKLGEFGGEKVVNIELSVAGGAVDSVELEFFQKSGASEETLESTDAHVGGVFEGHVVGDASGDGANFVVGKAEAAENFFGHAGADSFVAKESDAAVGIGFRGRRFPDIVEEGGEGEDRGRIFQVGEEEAGMDPDISFGVVFGRLGAVAHGEELGDPDSEKA